MFRKSVFVFFLSCFAMMHSPVLAQKKQKGLRPVAKTKPDGVYLLADGRKDSVVLRWVPSTDALWKLGNKYGYTVERFTVMKDGKTIPSANKVRRLLTEEPIKPWSHAAFTRLVDKVEFAGVVDEALYGADFNVQMNGETPKEILRQIQQSQNRFGFALLVCDFSPQVAKAAALRFVDKHPKAGERYIYRVKIAMPDSLSVSVHYNPGVTMLGPEEGFLRPGIMDLRAQFGDRTVSLGWNLEKLHGIYTAFNIERSINGGPFVQINEQPFLQMNTSKGDDKYAYYIDSLGAGNYVPYAYRITGITPFGDTGNWSDTASGQGISKLEYRPLFDSIRLAPNGSAALIHWTLPDSIVGVISGIYISKASRNQGPYTDINQAPLFASQRELVDPSVTGYSNYYRLRIVQKDGRQYTSLPYYLQKDDSIPPAVPIGLEGVSDKKGLVRIHWNANMEKDLKGYRLFRSQVKLGDYVEITKGPIADTAFMDTLNLSLTNAEVYYKVIALDHVWNSSDYSAPLTVHRPDTIAPMGVVFTGLSREDGAVRLAFSYSPSPDVRDYTLYRYNTSDYKRQVVAVFPAGHAGSTAGVAAGISGGAAGGGVIGRVSDGVDCTDEPAASDMGKTLVYDLMVTDSAGNRTTSRSGDLFFETGFRVPVSGFHGEADANGKKIKLSWKYDQAGVIRYVLYRSVDSDSAFVSYANIPGGAFSYEDTGLHVSNTYHYKIKAVMARGIESMLTEDITVKY